MNLNQKLTTNFTILELVQTSHKDLQQKNIDYALDNIGKLVELAQFAQQLRDFFGRPMTISSGVRCPQLNKKVGGTEKSQHLLIEAIDFAVSGRSAEETFKWVQQSYSGDYGQLILEQAGGKEWVHIGTGTKRECLIYKNGKYTKV